MWKKTILIFLCLFLGGLPLAAFSEEDSNEKDLTDLSFEDLGDIVTSVSKKKEKAFEAPAAIYVITQEDIRHSGATSLPEILRMAPGVHVARVDSTGWSITSRGFNSDGFGNKLLVLIDGRSVYTPLFSGVYWDVQDIVLEDISRIEVIRGPGATLWGANAVNGVINVITKSASKTQTNYVTVGAGNEEHFFTEGRHGGKINENLHYRTYAKYFNRDSSVTTSGRSGGNRWYQSRTGFRADWAKNSDEVTVQGDLYYGAEDINLSTLPNGEFRDQVLTVSGGNVLGRWRHKHQNESHSELQVYYDQANRYYSILDQNIHTFDVDYQYSTRFLDRHSITVGGRYRHIKDLLDGSSIMTFSPKKRGLHLYSGFIQDQINLIPERLNLTIGSKFEHNDYTGFEVQPSARLAFTPNEKNTFWGAVSRAVRTPNRAENDISLAVSPGFVRWQGNQNFDSEDLTAFELGYRTKPLRNLFFDSALFYNLYNDLRTLELSPGPLPPDTIVGLDGDNRAKGKSYGFELSSVWDVTNYWKLKASYSHLRIKLYSKQTTDIVFKAEENLTPQNQFNFISQLYLPKSVSLSNSIYFVDDVEASGIEEYIRFDTRVAWKPKPGIEFSLVGQNLFDDAHQESAAPLHGSANEIERSVYGQATFRF